LHSKFRKNANKSIKNAEFYADFKSVEKFFKMCKKIFICKNVKEIRTFSKFTHPPSNLFCGVSAQPMSTACAHEAHINVRNLTLDLTYENNLQSEKKSWSICVLTSKAFKIILLVAEERTFKFS
jgi:hypothetical protein